MANSYLIDLGINDTTADIVRKCNQNFRRISLDQQAHMKGNVRREQERSEGALDSAVGMLNDSINDAVTELDQYVTDTKDELQGLVDQANSKIDQLQTLIDELGQNIDDRFEGIEGELGNISWQTIYPIGAIYLSFSSTSPATLFGGTWVKLEDRFLRAANDTNTGGEDTVTLTTSELPSHSHSFERPVYSHDIAGTGYNYPQLLNSGDRYVITYPMPISGGYINSTEREGSSQPHNNMPAYQNIHAWRRTA